MHKLALKMRAVKRASEFVVRRLDGALVSAGLTPLQGHLKRAWLL